jgi:hypothetical protein
VPVRRSTRQDAASSCWDMASSVCIRKLVTLRARTTYFCIDIRVAYKGQQFDDRYGFL